MHCTHVCGTKSVYDRNVLVCYLPPWRNRLARSAVNRKVGGSSPPGGGFFLFRSIVAVCSQIHYASNKFMLYFG